MTGTGMSARSLSTYVSDVHICQRYFALLIDCRRAWEILWPVRDCPVRGVVSVTVSDFCHLF